MFNLFFAFVYFVNIRAQLYPQVRKIQWQKLCCMMIPFDLRKWMDVDSGDDYGGPSILDEEIEKG